MFINDIVEIEALYLQTEISQMFFDDDFEFSSYL